MFATRTVYVCRSDMMVWVLVVAFAVLIGGPASAVEPSLGKALSKEARSITHHVIEIGGRPLEYTATAATVDVAIEGAAEPARIFFVSYAKDEASPEDRPLAFVFNGGPGASSAYLHLLALGPKVADFGADGKIPAPPVRLTDNPSTWLNFTDLVFVDPAGTGYSAIPEREEAGADNAETGKANDTTKGTKEGASGPQFWNAERDLEAIGEFMRLYLVRNARWASPKFIIGESYGGFRAAALPERLASEPGIRLNGIVMISPVLEFSQLELDAYRLTPWVSLLPVYAATAYRHGQSPHEGPLRAVMEDAERLATGDYVKWLARAGDDEDAFYADLAEQIGLPSELVRRHGGRIPRSVFAKQLLREKRRIVSLYDGSVTAVDPDPASPHLGTDPVLKGLTAPLATAFNRYIRENLRFETELPYSVLNHKVSRKWGWSLGGRTGRASLGAADALKEAMSLDPHLTAFIAHGAFDMVTPYPASRFAVRRMELDPAVAENLVFKVYEGGHMPYTHADVRAALFRDAQAFFRNAAGGAP